MPSRFFSRFFSHGAVRFTVQLLLRLRGAAVAPRIVFPSILRVGRTAAAPRSANLILRVFQATTRNSRAIIRPFSTLDHNRIRVARLRKRSRRFRPLIGRTKPKTAADRIKEMFLTNVRYNPDLLIVEYPERLDRYEIGSNIACGCHAAVYELRLLPEGNFSSRVSLSTNPSRSPLTIEESQEDRLHMYPLALKIMFNYQFDAPERYLWTEMGTELVPLTKGDRLVKGYISNFRPLPRPHPNVIKMYTAFVDRMPILTDAHRLYPEALPSAKFYELVVEEPRTLFIVMKRYRMTLREYVLTKKRNYWTGRVLLGQLLEAIVYLYMHTISHRDMKSDNILLDFDHDDDIPHLVLSDFGCALATGSWMVYYPNDYVDLGGNLALRAPEVRCAEAGGDSFVDFRLADLWACGTLGYEIFTRSNPFYSRMKSHNYAECELPPLPRRVHYAVQILIREILRRDPNLRPDPRVAANVLSISLFRFGDDVRRFLDDCGLDEMIIGTRTSRLGKSRSRAVRLLGFLQERAVDEVTMLYAAETVMARRLEPGVVGEAELQLRATFLSRLDREQFWSALTYFYLDESDFEDMSGSVSRTSSSMSGQGDQII